MSAFKEVADELEVVINGTAAERAKVLLGNSITILMALKIASRQRPVWVQQPDGTYKEGWEPAHPEREAKG